ncbi:hypothetical protein AaE_000928 [Aphanomyces astaci]|uniref:Uncharacterized protein n=2 Tax=Aphanomyces astaci TaxID=112090 RepID=A0A6A5AJK2_APHAT|nr:hypothetical protein AaE_000928 [Aphanomyces astaci]
MSFESVGSSLSISALSEPNVSYWRYLEDIYHLKNGLDNWLAFYNAQVAACSDNMKEVEVAASFSNREMDAMRHLTKQRVADVVCAVQRASSVKAKWFSPATAPYFPGHLQQIAEAISRGLLRRQCDIV